MTKTQSDWLKSFGMGQFGEGEVGALVASAGAEFSIILR